MSSAIGLDRTSLRARFAFAMLLWVVVGLLLVGVSATALFRRHVEGVFHAELEEHLHELIALSSTAADGRPHLSRPLSDPRFGTPGSGYYWQIGGNGGPLLRSVSLGAETLDDRLAHTATITHVRAPGPNGPAMIYGATRPTATSYEHYLVATDMRHLDDTVAAFRRDLVLWLGATALALLIGAVLALRIATRPLDRLAAAVAAVRGGTAHRLGGPWPTEVAPLAADLDRLLDSREAMVAAARIEAGNLAHGLRNSLALLTDEAENLADAPAGATLLAECRRIARQLDWHLARARSAAGEGVVRETRLPGAIDPLMTAMRRLYRDIRFTADGPPVTVAIDPEPFAEILSNLLDNAGKWASSAVAVTWQNDSAAVRLCVIDDGPGVPPEALDRLFMPGVRLDEQVGGHGLGLAIARDLASQAQATLDLAARDDGRPGAMAVLVLRPA
jgi:signal transduction histidine kinase